MSVLTRNISKDIRNRLVSLMLDGEDGTRFADGLERLGIRDLEDLLSMDPDEISNFKFVTKDPNTNITVVNDASIGDKRKITLLLQWVSIKKLESPHPLTIDEWNALHPDDFHAYRRDLFNPFEKFMEKRTTRVNNNDTIENKQKQEIEMFKRSIKRDASLYPTLREDVQWDSWNRTTLTLARTHDVSEVFDTNYVPDNEYSKELFDQKQAFVYSVFNRIILTDMGKTIVRLHEATFDAQQAYKDLVSYAKKSTAANINIDNLAKQMHNLTLDTRWTGTTKGFILNWRDKMRQYEELAVADEHFTSAQKKRMLQAAVFSVTELRQVQTQDEHSKSTGGVALSYLEYLDLVLSAATRRDAELKLPPQRSRRNVNMLDSNYDLEHHNSNLDKLYHYDDYYTAYTNGEYDEYVSYEVNMATNSYLSKEVWDKLSPEAKHKLLQSRKTNNGYRQPKPYYSQPNTRNLSSKPTNTNYPTRMTNQHSTEETTEERFYECDNEVNELNYQPSTSNIDTNVEVNKLEQSMLHPGDVRHVLTTASKTKKPNMQANTNKRTMVIDGVTWYTANTIVLTYSTFNGRLYPTLGSLVDRGANGGIAGNDVMLIETTHRTCDVSGIDNHTMVGLPIATCAGLVNTIDGNIIVILHQYAYSGKGNTIHSSAQIEHFGNLVDDKSKRVGGKQQITTLDNYVLDLSIRNGLAYLDMSKPTDHEFSSLPHVVLTSDLEWNPSVLDYENDDLVQPIRANTHVSSSLVPNEATYSDYVDDLVDLVLVNKTKVDINDPKFDLLQPNFGYAPTDIIKKTFECTTQWARMIERYPFRKHFKSRFPAFNVIRRNEPVATDTIFSDTPALGNGCYLAQIFVGTKTIVTDVYPMKFESDFPSTLQESIRHRGAMSKLISDYANVETSTKVKDILRHYCIQDWQSEPYHQHQNAAERRYQTIKRYTKTILDYTGAPPNTWLLVLHYVCYVLNLTYVDKLGTVPLEKLTGQTQDISILLPFSFWEPIYYATGDALAYNTSVSFPSQTSEGKGRFVGFGESVGDALTFLVLTNDTNKLLYRSSVRSAVTTPPNLRLDNLEGEIVTNNNLEDVNSNSDSSLVQPSLGESLYTDLTKQFIDNEDSCYVDDPLMLAKDYNKVIDNLERTHDTNIDPEDILWRFKDIIGHEGPLYPHMPNYKHSLYNVLVMWEDDTTTYEPLNVIAEDNPIACAEYAKANNLLNTRGWKHFRNLLSTEYKINRLVLAAKQNVSHNSVKYKFGIQVPRTTKEAMELDLKLGQTKWNEAIQTELEQIHNYETFKNLGKDAKLPEGYTKIRVRFVFDIKHDGRHKARLVAGGHLTDEPDDSVYSSVVSLRDLRLVIFAGEQNNLDIWAADVGNAYLESYTKEKVYIIAGPEFGELEGCTLVINKALYGLRSSGLRWHERFADTLRDLGFRTCKASPDVWMRPKHDYYEYIAVYVDDLAIVAKEPKLIVDILQNKYNYKLKGVGPIDYHLGGNFGRDEDGTLNYGPRKYIDKLLANYLKQFGTYPVERVSPLEHGDHPEEDNSPELSLDGIKLYQSMIGALQWTTSLGRFDILSAVMTMSRFRVAPHEGHLDRLKRIYGYLRKHKNGAIRFRTNLPDFSMLESTNYSWENKVYKLEEQELEEQYSDMPASLGHPVVTITYVDANLMHCNITGRASTGILHLVNGTPVDWYSKRQSTVQSATYGSEFVAARIATDQIIDLKLTLGYLGIKVIKSMMFGDNQSVVTSATIPHSKLNKRHVALSYHRVREAIAQKVVEFYHIDGKINPADMLSKFAGYQQFWPILRSLLFWGGNKEGLYNDNKDTKA